MSWQPFEERLIKLSPDTIINQEKRSVLDRKPSQVTDQKVNQRFRNRFLKPRDGNTGRYIVHETDAHCAEEDPNFEEEESCEEESDLPAAFESVTDELASVEEELEDTLDVEGRGRSARTFKVHVRGTRHHQRDTRNAGRNKESRFTSLHRQPLLTQLSVRDMPP